MIKCLLNSFPSLNLACIPSSGSVYYMLLSVLYIKVFCRYLYPSLVSLPAIWRTVGYLYGLSY